MVPAEQKQPNRLDSLLHRALLLDLEVSHQGHILKIGAVLGEEILPGAGSKATLDTVAALAEKASCVLGHNLISYDLNVLSETAANHPLLKLPVIDTLILSPLAFPENPYHRLIKDYKLVSESVNDSLTRARPLPCSPMNSVRSTAYGKPNQTSFRYCISCSRRRTTHSTGSH